MILKKPYAFLIKNFKKIHIILAVTLSFILYRTYMIYKFFKSSAANNYYASLSYDDRNLYVNFFIFLVLILILVAFIAIYYLLNHKKKPRKFYIYSIIYYLILFVYYVILANIFKGLLESTIDMQAIRALKDISLISMLPQLAIVIYTILISVGVNLKKYNFSEDLKELEITESDSEEVELSIGFEGYKTKRSLRRQLREFTYYVKENKFVISCILIIVGVILGFSIFGKLINKLTTRSGGSTISNKFTTKVEETVITNLKPNGDLIDDNYYLIVKLYLKNNTNTNAALDYTNYHLVFKNHNITPTLNLSQYFYDIGQTYLGGNISPQEEKTISLVFKIPEKNIDSKFTLKIYKGSTATEKSLKANYNEIKLKPKKQLDLGDAVKVNMGEELSFANSNIGNSKIVVTNYELANSYKYKYDDCSSGTCNSKDVIITPDYLNSNKSPYLMIIDYTYTPDTTTVYGKYNNTIQTFIDDFLKVKYTINGKTYYSNVLSRDTKNLEGKAVFQLDKEAANASNLELVFIIRNRKHSIVLK